MGVIWSVKTGTSPRSKRPVKGRGSWIVNKHSGYYLGRALVGSQFEVLYTSKSKKEWHYGLARAPLNICGWILPNSRRSKIRSVPDSFPAADRRKIARRLSFGRDFNAPAGLAEDGTEVEVLKDCTFYYNYFAGHPLRGGHWRDAAMRKLKAGTKVKYRFITRNRSDPAAVIKHPTYGWGFVRANCVAKPTDVFNDNDP